MYDVKIALSASTAADTGNTGAAGNWLSRTFDRWLVSMSSFVLFL